MRRIYLLFLATILSAVPLLADDIVPAQTDNGKTPFTIKVYPFRGSYLVNPTHYSKFGEIYPAGVNLGLELPSQGQKPWQQYLGNPTVGLGLSWIDLGDESPTAPRIGHSVVLYPYIMFNAIDTQHFQMKFKLAGGMAVVTEHWYTQEDQNPDHYLEPTVNTIFGCYLNAYLNAGVNLNVPITRGVALGTEFGFFHMSNGRICMPNIGVNAIYGSVGLSATFNSDSEKPALSFPDQPYGWALNITGGVGVHKATMSDPGRFLINSFHVGSVYHVNNWYGVGVGVDVFHSGAVTKNTNHDLFCDGQYEIEGELVDCTTCGDESGVDYSTKQRIRAGIALNNEFKFGIVTAILDWGVYMYNPYRNLYNDYHRDYLGEVAPKRPMIYKTRTGAHRDEAFNYWRLGARCRVCDNVFVQMALKAHIDVAEFIEFGLGYQIPYLKKANRKDGSIVYHHRKDWWKEW